MIGRGIPLDKAELLSMVLEGVLYGVSLPMFGGTIWVLLSQRTAGQINRKTFTAACLLLLCSTAHMVINIIRIIQGFILFRDAFPGGPVGYFADVSQWTFVCKNYVYSVQTLIGDAVVLYRCYVVWQSKLIMILPTLLWCAVLATGIACPYAESQTTQAEVFGGSLSQWITSFWASTLTTNLLTTSLLAYRIWRVNQMATSSLDQRKSQLQPILRIITDAGMMYSITLFTALICFVNQSNGQYVILDMITPIISITFYMVIIRVGLAGRAKQPTHTLQHGYTLPHGYTTTGNSICLDRRSRAQVEITSYVENHVSSGLRSMTSPRASVFVESDDRNEYDLCKSDGISDVV